MENKEEKEIVDEEEVVEFDGDEEVGQGEQLKKLRQKLKTALDQKQEYLTGWQRAKADFINLRKQDEERQKGVVKYAKEDLLIQIIPVLDSFDLALGNQKALSDLPENWVAGVKNINNQLLSILADNGVRPVDPVGEVFDPKRDEAIEMIPTKDEAEDQKIRAVIQKGYLLHDHLIRPAKVKVAQLE